MVSYKSSFLTIFHSNLVLSYRYPTGSFTDPSTTFGVHGAHPLGSPVLRRQARSDNDAYERGITSHLS